PPAAMPTAALEARLHRRAPLRPLAADAFERHPGVGPHVHDVDDLVVMLRVRAEELLRLEREPGVDPAPRDPLGGRLDQLLGARMALAGLFVHEQRNRHPPGALARDTPVGAALDHAADTLLAPCGG